MEISLTDARAGLQACVELARIEQMDSEVLAANPDLFKEVRRLCKEDPELFQALSNLIGSGAKLSAVRDIEPERIGL